MNGCWLNEDCIRGHHTEGECRFPSSQVDRWRRIANRCTIAQEEAEAQVASLRGRIENLLREWDAVNLTLPGHPGEPTSDSNYRAGFYKAASIARSDLRDALDGGAA